uniref:Elongation of fatty acids protein n=1 Tax=Chromera velia CCMP2878 TaxID=1169474 RepID=A0A0G4I034_9ALVE|eukprot:Cvel_1604.t1-p1 / transcript=Cvel_1604.t1 / gene=Cvel_1604 / organism=Chromera_velia_CCMP2878 / gene_product=Elongation of very long chain fatty acids protein 2, putative / transcript_product=Elongation of very long chain fatty acids protein 2, putative / location=Cvel_scaffold57:94480-95370(+) / protein_length=297 / sequence_SO=supercontig / SO=protein_coding / is_pseudo=false
MSVAGDGDGIAMAHIGDVDADIIGGPFSEWCEETSKKILTWIGEGRDTQVTAGYPFATMEAAILVVGAYLAFVFFGSLFMSVFRIPAMERVTYPFRFVYNVAQVMLCSYMTIEAVLLAYRNDYGLVPCVKFNPQNPPVANLLWMFYISKIFDFADTIFIILGKKWQQLSFLHVYHHATIFSIYWVNLRLGYDGDVYLTIVLNGFIHAVMYTYYFLSMHTKDIWWKSKLTSMQMLQFICMNVQASWMLLNGCQQYPPRLTAIYLVYIMSLFLLFAQFFVRTYSKKGGKDKDTLEKKKV